MLQATTAQETEPVPATRARAWLVEVLPVLPVLAVLFVVVLQLATPLDSNYFWHLATGQLILRQGYPTVEPFSWTYGGAAWRPNDWLTDVLLAWLYQGLGHAGPTLAMSLAGLGAWVVAYGRARLLGAGHLAASIMVTAGLLAVASLIAVRPLMLLWLGVNLAALLIERALVTGSARWLLGVPVVAALGANLHRGTPPIIAALAGLGVVHLLLLAAWRARQRRGGAGLLVRRAGLLLLVGVLVLAAGALTPAGLSGLTRSLAIVADPSIQGLIAEWQSPDFHRPDMRFFQVLLLGGLFIFARWGPRRPELWPYAALLVLGTAAAALQSVRHIALYALLAGPWLAAAPPLRDVRLTLRPIVAVSLVWTSLLLSGLSLAQLAGTQWQERESRDYPRASVDWLAQLCSLLLFY